MTNSFLISHSRETGTNQLWAWNPDDPDNRFTPIEAPPVVEGLGSGYQLTAVGSYLLCHKPPASVELGETAFVDFTLLRLDNTGSALALSIVQQGSWYWDKFADGYSYTNAPGGAQRTDLQLLGITGYVMSRLSTPGRSGFGLWSFDAYNDAPGGSVDPIRVSMAATPCAFPCIAEDDVLIPIQNCVLVLNYANNSWRTFSFDPQRPNPLNTPVMASGTLPTGLNQAVLAVGEQLLAWTPGESAYAIYTFSPANPFTSPTTGTLPAGFVADGSTTLTSLHPPKPVRAEHAEAPGTMDFMRNNIKHVVYYVLESRSFDSVVGWLYDQQDAASINWVGAPANAAFAGASTAYYNEDAAGAKYFQKQYMNGAVSTGFNLNSPTLDPYHGTVDAILQQWKGGYASYTGGKTADMNGFVLNNGSAQVMETYSPVQLSILNTLAQWYAVSDLWFCSEAGGTTTNRATLASGSAYNITTDYEGGTAYANFPQSPHRQSMWKVLANNGIMDWAIYYSVLWENHPYTYHLFLEGQLPSVDGCAGQYVQPIDSFLDAAANGKLPAFSFLEPVWIDPSGLFTSYHPAGNVLPGEQALKNIFEALTRNEESWNETVLVISFSKGGGLYDHISAKPMPKAWPNDGDDGYQFNTTGTRVPTLIVSPRVKKNTVFRSGSSTFFDATSLAATVLSWFGIPRSRWGMGERIANAPTFEAVFQLTTPRTDLPTLTRAIDKTYPTPDPISVASPVPVSSTWNSSGGSGVWTDRQNWSGSALPTDVATFDASTNLTVSFSFTSPQVVNTVVFTPQAPAYTLLFDEESPASPMLSIAGAGVTNQSAQNQTFNVQASSVSTTQVQLAFLNRANAGGSNVTYTVGPTTPASQSGGIIAFNQRSSAGSAHFDVSVGSRPPGAYSTVGGEVRFLHHSTAATASFTVSGTTGTDSDTFGNVVFHHYATAAAATFINVWGTVGDGGNTQFYEQATAAQATITNQGATGEYGNGGDTAFDGTATAANASITNEAAQQGHGGVTSFNNNKPYMAPTFGATAGNATINNLGGQSDQAGTGGHTEFTGIYGAGNAGTATINNYGSASSIAQSGGYTLFAVNGEWPYARPSAGQATITNYPSTNSGAVPGSTNFTYQNWHSHGDDRTPGPTAGSAKIINKGATVAGALGGTTTFNYQATADHASLTAEGGQNGGGPGIIYFKGYADGGSATVLLQGGTLDLTDSLQTILTLSALAVSDGSTIVCEVGDGTPLVSVSDSFTLVGATACFAFSLAHGKSLPTAPVTLLEAASLATMTADQFSGTMTGAACSLTIDKTTTPPRLLVTFAPANER